MDTTVNFEADKARIARAILNIDNDEVLEKVKRSLNRILKLKDSIPIQHIPGLPYTHEERIESLRKAEENIAAGKVHSHEKVMKEMRERIQSWK